MVFNHNTYTHDKYGNIDGVLNSETILLESGKSITTLTYAKVNTDINTKVDNLLNKLSTTNR